MVCPVQERRESAMARKFVRKFIPAIGILLAAFGSAQAQSRNPVALPTAPPSIAGAFGVSPPGANSSGSGIDPALNLRGMPCSVSLNATGGITTTPSCGSDPLEVPTRTLVSPGQVNGSQAPSAPTSGGSVTGGPQSPAQPSSGTTSGAAVSRAGTTAQVANPSSGAGGGVAPGASALCSTTIPATGGPTGAASLIGGC